MTTTITPNRTDVHRPVELVTEDYDLIMTVDSREPQIGPDQMTVWAVQQMQLRAEACRLVASSPLRRGITQCHHCGAHIRFAAIMHHRPSGQHIAVGEQCLDNRFDRASADFHRLRKAAELDRQKQRIRGLVAKFVEANPDLAFMADKDHEYTNSFVADVARKLRQYGELSERQVDAVRRSVVRDAERQAEREQKADLTAPVVEGRIVITGEVLTVKWQDSDFGSTLKMLVKDDRHFKVWGTVPSSLQGVTYQASDPDSYTGIGMVDRGDRVTFTATVERSRDDEAFGFFKRPTKAVRLAVAS